MSARNMTGNLQCLFCDGKWAIMEDSEGNCYAVHSHPHCPRFAADTDGAGVIGEQKERLVN